MAMPSKQNDFAMSQAYELACAHLNKVKVMHVGNTQQLQKVVARTIVRHVSLGELDVNRIIRRALFAAYEENMKEKLCAKS